jgi:hypothetical protein
MYLLFYDKVDILSTWPDMIVTRKVRVIFLYFYPDNPFSLYTQHHTLLLENLDCLENQCKVGSTAHYILD